MKTGLNYIKLHKLNDDGNRIHICIVPEFMPKQMTPKIYNDDIVLQMSIKSLI